MQTRHILPIGSHDLRLDGVVSWRNLLGKLNILDDFEVAFLERAFEVDILNGLAEVGGLVDDGYEAVFYG